jgi:hypothetical protein
MKTNAPDPGPAPKTRRRAFRGELAALKDGPLSVLRERAIALGFRCLSDSWTDYHSHYRFECAVGHQFDRTATTVLYGDGGCLACKRDALAEFWLAKVSAKGGALVQGSFTGMLDRYRLRCAAGHEWEAQGRKISEGSWCPACGRESAALRIRGNALAPRHDR